MYTILVRLMLVAAFLELGLSVTDLRNPTKLESASRKVLRVQWRPISVFPEEAKRFR